MMQPFELALALLHYPVYNKRGDVVTTAVTNLDIHDIARSSRTFGVSRFYLVTPSVSQQQLAARITGHWKEGWGASYNPDRKDALETVALVDTLDGAVGDFMAVSGGKRVRTVATTASRYPGNIGFDALSSLMRSSPDAYMILMGTGWGMTEECISSADYVLEPICGHADYNHLSVRSAAAIILDRLRRF